MRPKGNAAVPPLRRPGAALAGASGVLLNSGLAAATGYLCPGLGIVGALALVVLINNQRLVDQGLVHRHIKDSIFQVDGIYYIALLVFNRDFHKMPEDS